jgi:acetoin utilization protein AcuB
MVDIKTYQISNLATTDIVSAKPNQLMTDVCLMFDNNSFHHIPVINDENKCIGIISKTDYAQLQDKFSKFSYKSADVNNRVFFRSLLAQDVMTPEVVSLAYTEVLEKAIEIFEQNKVHSIVVTKDDHFFGILTPIDLLSLLK